MRGGAQPRRAAASLRRVECAPHRRLRRGPLRGRELALRRRRGRVGGEGEGGGGGVEDDDGAETDPGAEDGVHTARRVGVQFTVLHSQMRLLSLHACYEAKNAL
jgi:hypothetical protein